MGKILSEDKECVVSAVVQRRADAGKWLPCAWDSLVHRVRSRWLIVRILSSELWSRFKVCGLPRLCVILRAYYSSISTTVEGRKYRK